MGKYWEIVRIHLNDYIVYRVNFFILRIRGLIPFFIIYFLWQSIYANRSTIEAYNFSLMITYVFVSKVLLEIASSTTINNLGAMILNGDLINYILKPISIIKSFFVIDLADKILNFGFSLIEIGFLILILRPHLFLQKNPNAYFLLLFFLIFSILISFFIYFMISSAAFWTNQIWALRFSYMTISTLFAGGLFPLDLLPKAIYKIFLLTPFPYLYFIPTKIYLEGRINNLNIILPSLFFWTISLYLLSMFIWKKGLKNYTYYGR